MQRWSSPTLALSWSSTQYCVKMLLQQRLLKRPQEQLSDALAAASLSGICWALVENPGKDPLAKGHNAITNSQDWFMVPQLPMA